jgi:hypothetical protein
VALALASIDLVLLAILAMTVTLVRTPVPRAWALAATALLSVQGVAVLQMELARAVPRSHAIVHSAAEAVAVLVVPALTSALLTIVFLHCARSFARTRAARRAAQAIGSDMPTGWGGADGTGSCITGSSIGDSATSPRAA